jgi:hypothetical protein
MDKMYKIFTQAIRNGWQPTVEGVDLSIRSDAQLTWFPSFKMIVVPSNKGTVELTKDDLKEAKKYIKNKQDNKENHGR